MEVAPTQLPVAGALSVRSKVKVPVAMIGNWKHPSYSEVSFTQEDFDRIKSNYASNTLGYKPYLTFGHLNEEPDSTDPHRKRGDADAVVQEGIVLYGIFDTPSYIAQMIDSGEYEYSSGEFIRNLMDKKDGTGLGCALSRVALTNSPFIPFGDVKAQVLSQTEPCDLSVTTFTIKLSQSESNLPDNPETAEPIPEPIPETTPEIPIESNPIEPTPSKETPIADLTPSKKEETVMTNQIPDPVPQPSPEPQAPAVTPVISQPVQTPAQVPAPIQAPIPPTPVQAPVAPVAPAPQLDLEALVDQIKKAIQVEHQSEKAQSQAIIASLQSELVGLKADLVKQKETAQVFSQTVAKAQEKAQQEQLLSQGMPPAVIPKYIALHNAVLGNQSVMKLSLGAEGEKDVTTLSLLHEVITECLSLGGVPLGQLGSTVQAPASGGLIGDLKAIAERNKQLANQSNKG